jgi:hypothetical protein
MIRNYRYPQEGSDANVRQSRQKTIIGPKGTIICQKLFADCHITKIIVGYLLAVFTGFIMFAMISD